MSRPVPPRTEDTPEAVRDYWHDIQRQEYADEMERPQRGEY